jgi:hypothetical protein
MGYGVWGKGEWGRLPKLFLRDNYSDGYSSVELQIRERSLSLQGTKELGVRNARLEECKSNFFLFLFLQGRF